jgi:glycolate oxidase iron-sulfur subunit
MNEADWCCGSAGVYNITQPVLAGEVLKRKMANVAATRADVIAVGNTGCLIQLAAGVRQAGLKMRVVHPVDLLDKAYRNEGQT